MRLIICLSVALAVALVAQAEEQQQRILRRVIKSTPTATNLGRVRQVTIRSTPSGAEKGAVAEISSKDAANFGQRSVNETTTSQGSTKSSSSTTTTTTQSSPASTSTTSATPTTQPTSTTTSASTEAPKQETANRQAASSQPEVELLSGAPSSWQTMTAVEAPAAMLIASGVRSGSNDLSSSSSTLHSSEESASTGDFLRSSATKGAASYTQQEESYSRLQQQQRSTQQQQQSFFYPQSARAVSKTASVKGTKTSWYQPPPTTSTTPRPAPLIQEQQYEQVNEQYVEQAPQIEYGAAPLGQAEPFAFDFKTQDQSGNGQYRKEESDKNGVVRGSYGYTDANGIYRHVEYVADQNGFRANIKSNEPGLNGETQPASIQLNGGQATPASPQRLSAPASSVSDNGDWISNQDSGSSSSSANLALAPPNFESAHRSDRIRAPRQYLN